MQKLIFKSLLIGIISKFSLISLCSSVNSHGENIFRGKLIETEPQTYQLTIKLPINYTSQLKQPILPNHCQFLQDKQKQYKIENRRLNYHFFCEKKGLNNQDKITLPWQISGLIITAEWLNGTSKNYFFISQWQGVDIYLSKLITVDNLLYSRIKYYLILGIKHSLIGYNHWLLTIAILLIPTFQQKLKLITAFSLGQFLSLLVFWFIPLYIPLIPAEAVILIVILILVRQSLQDNYQFNKLEVIITVTGLLHGLGIISLLSPQLLVTKELIINFLSIILGIEFTNLIILITSVSIIHLPYSRKLVDNFLVKKVINYILGILSLTMILLYFPKQNQLMGNMANLSRDQDLYSELVTANNTRIADLRPTPLQRNNINLVNEQSPIKVFIDIDRHEIRQEILVKVDYFNFINTTYIDIKSQPLVKQKILEDVLRQNKLFINLQEAKPTVERIEFMNHDNNYPIARHSSIQEKTNQAIIGISLSYKFSGLPDTLKLKWQNLSPKITLPIMIIDPEKIIKENITSNKNEIFWQNRLQDDDLPQIRTVSLTYPFITIPLVSLLITILLIFTYLKYRHIIQRNYQFILIRLAFPLIILFYSTWQIKLPFLNFGYYRPSINEASLVVKKLLTNIYYSFEFTTEEEIYDQLSLSITGETLTKTYLDYLNSLGNNSLEGIKMRVEDINIIKLSQLNPSQNGFKVQVIWQVNSSISHFGHIHFRSNQYQANFIVSAEDSYWKVNSIELIDEL